MLNPRLFIIFASLHFFSWSHAAEVKLRGLDENLRKEMSALIKPRLEFISKRPATEWRADDAAFFLHELLIKRGYAYSKVGWELPDNNVILLKADLGKQYFIGKISTNSKDSISGKDLEIYFKKVIKDGNLLENKNAPFTDDYPEKGATNIANFLKSQGYWDANVTVASVKKQASGKVDIQLNILRGKLHSLQNPTFKGISNQQLTNVKAATTTFVGKPATSENISALNNAVHEHFRDQGYQFAKLDISSKNTHGIQFHYHINTGNLYKVRTIEVTGNEITKRSRFNRYLKPLVGEVYRKSSANEVTNKLLLTGAFRSARLRPKKVSSNELDLVLKVEEAKPNFIRAYAGAASFDGLILGVSYTHQNFLHNLQTLTARTEISARGLLGEVSLTEPYFAGLPITNTNRIYSLQRRFDGYDVIRSGLGTSFDWEPGSSLTSRLYGAVEYVDSNSTFLTSAELGPNDYLNAKIGFEQILDLRDSQILPTKGLHARGLLEYGAITGDASESYFKTDFTTSYRYLLNEKSKQRFIFRFKAGAIFPSESSDLPIDLRLFSGGAESIRSYRERVLGKQSGSGDPLGGEAYWTANTEYIHPFNDLFSGVLFYDMGNIFQNASDFSFSQPQHSLGLGVRIDLPVGPARFEYGYNLNRKNGEPRGAFHFSIGAQF